ncbi:MAG: RecQ family ATP-dependent DNA helicase, partial [Bacteroidota bacterium]|nr:RecQ family ATP-dependent DNA helicase [Bacteroidota bacterium]
MEEKACIDTLYLSPLLFPKKPYHALVKDDKLDPDGYNNPLNDAIKAKDLFYAEVNAFHALPDALRDLFFLLLYDRKEFAAFFTCIGYFTDKDASSETQIIKNYFFGKICDSVSLSVLIKENPISLAYALALINVNDKYSITPKWVLKNFPDIENIMFLLRNKPCFTGCDFCNQSFDPVRGLKRIFGFTAFREYDGVPLQEKAVEAALKNESLLAIFPTGG